MNFYKRHLGDYAKDTGHLTMLEHGAYTLLLDRYYGTESPIPVAEAYRVCRARTKEEKAAVDVVLDEFFDLKGDAWHSKRADAEIAENQDQSEDRDLRKQNERERQRRHREERKRLFSDLHELDIVPTFDTKTETLRSMLDDARATRQSPHVTRVVTLPVTRDATANQTPDSRLQTPDSKENTDASSRGKPLNVRDLVALGIPEESARDWMAIRRAKKAVLTPTAWKLIETQAAIAGISTAEAVRLSAENNWAGFKADWLKTTGFNGASSRAADPFEGAI